MVSCVGMDVAMDAAGQMLGINCDDPNLLESGKACAKDCLWSLIPIPRPCKYSDAVGTAIGVGGAVLDGGGGVEEGRGSGGFGGWALPRFGEGGLRDNSFAGDTLVHVKGLDGGPALKPIADIKLEMKYWLGTRWP